MDIAQSAILLFSKVLHSTQCFWTNIWFRRWQVETLNMNIYCFWVRKEQTSSANITKHTENCRNVKDNRCNIFGTISLEIHRTPFLAYTHRLKYLKDKTIPNCVSKKKETLRAWLHIPIVTFCTLSKCVGRSVHTWANWIFQGLMGRFFKNRSRGVKLGEFEFQL